MPGFNPFAFARGFTGPAVSVSDADILLSGVDAGARARDGSIAIQWALNDTPNTASLTIEGTAPQAGQKLTISVGTPPVRLFTGALDDIELSYELQPHQLAYRCSAIDDWARLNRRRPFGTWTDVSATVVGQAITADFSDFSDAGIEADLPLVTVNFDGTEGFSGCLAQLAKLIGGSCDADDGVVYLFQTAPAGAAPNPIDALHPFLDDPPIAWKVDTSQLRTRVYGRGHQETVLAAVAAGDTSVPISSAVMFNPAGGKAITATVPAGAPWQRINYTGLILEGDGSLVGPALAPSAKPGAQVSGGGAVDTGDHDYANTFKTAAGETLPSPLKRVTTSTVPLAAPADTPVAFLNPAEAGIGTGLTNGTTYRWLITYSVDATHETTAGVVSNAIVANGADGVDVSFAAPPVLVNGNMTVKIYRLIAGVYHLESSGLYGNGGHFSGLGGPTDAALTGAAQPPATNTATYATVTLSGIALGPTGTTQRKIYRTAVGSAQLKLLSTIPNNTTTSGGVDVALDSTLGANAPVADTSGLTAVAGQVNAGSTSLVTSGWPFGTAGWVQIGGQLVRYTGVTGNTLTGIPASGIGSLVSTVKYGEHVDVAGALTGVTGLGTALVAGVPLHIWVQRDDPAAQADQAAIDTLNGVTPADGIYEGPIITDDRRGEASLIALCDATLAAYSRPLVTVSYDTRDLKTKTGKQVVVDLVEPPIHETLTIQSVGISEIDVVPGLAPRFHVTASSTRFSLDTLLRLMLARGGGI